MSADTTHAEDVVPEPATDGALGEPRPTRVWVVRANGGKYTHHFVAGGYAGCSESTDVASARSREEIRLRYEQADPGAGPKRTGGQVGQLASFLLDMQEGDYVITPEADTEWLRYGRVSGPCVSATEGDGCPYRNRRQVEWADTRLRRHDFSESFQNTLGSLLAVFEVGQRNEFLVAIDGATRAPKKSVIPKSGSEIQVGSRDSIETQTRLGPAGTPDGTAEGESESGVEVEREDPRQGTTERPFDPSKIKVRTVNVVVDQIVSRIKYGEIDLQPDFQRVRGIWDAQRRSRLIESLLLRIPIPVFYVAADHDEKWAVVDGVQRISTIHDYMAGEFALTRLEYRQEFDGKCYGELPRPMQRRISETQLVVNVIEPGTSPEVMFNIFRRINTGGMTLNGQEIRHALNPGQVRDYPKMLAETDEFLEATDRSIRPRRMADRECVLRFLAFHIEPWERYAADSLESYLERAMKTINGMAAERLDVLAGDFKKAMRAATRIFGNDAFRKRYRPEDSRHQISLALFEAWGVQLARCSAEELERLVARRTEVRDGFMSLLNRDAEFEKAISVSTGTPQRIRKRFAAVRDLVKGVH